jgi:hypothetical protein
MKNKGGLLLTILCVVTILWSGFSILNQVYFYKNIETFKVKGDERYKVQIEKAKTPNAVARIEYQQKKFYQKYLHKSELVSVGILGDILCIVGAVLMWFGFVYGLPFFIVGQILPFSYLFYLSGIQSDFQIMISEFYGLIIPVIMMVLFITQIGGSKKEA